jgi:hypothetical protein
MQHNFRNYTDFGVKFWQNPNNCENQAIAAHHLQYLSIANLNEELAIAGCDSS